MSIRYDILRALVNSRVMQTVEELMESCNVTDRKRMVNNIQQGITDRLIARHYDDVTGHPGYTVTALGAARLSSAAIQYNGKSQAENTARPALLKTYGLTLLQLEEIADAIAFFDGLCDEKAAKDKISRAHQIIETALGDKAYLLYDQEQAA